MTLLYGLQYTLIDITWPKNNWYWSLCFYNHYPLLDNPLRLIAMSSRKSPSVATCGIDCKKKSLHTPVHSHHPLWVTPPYFSPVRHPPSKIPNSCKTPPNRCIYWVLLNQLNHIIPAKWKLKSSNFCMEFWQPAVSAVIYVVMRMRISLLNKFWFSFYVAV